MNKIWQARLENCHQKRKKRRKIKSFFKTTKNFLIGVIVFYIVFPHPVQRILYPLLWAEKYDNPMIVSSYDIYNDTTAESFMFSRNGIKYQIMPKIKYKVTGKVAYIDNYDTFWNRFYRGQTQKNYINLVPLDLIIVIGNMAKPEIFKNAWEKSNAKMLFIENHLLASVILRLKLKKANKLGRNANHI